MPVSRPSRAAEPSRPPKGREKEWAFDEHEEEKAKVDRKLAQLEEARARKEETKAQRLEEKERKKWESLKRSLGLARRQELLLRAVDGKTLTTKEAVETIYKVSWARLSKKTQQKYLGRLRTLQNATNRKLAEKNFSMCVSTVRQAVRLVFVKDWKKRTGTAKTKRKRKRGALVTECAQFLRFLFKKGSHLKDGWLPVNVLNRLASREGHGESSVRNARKRLRLVRIFVVSGEEREWRVGFSSSKRPKT